MENILPTYNFSSLNQNLDEFRCVICGYILINACQTVCGCNFCKDCGDARVQAGDTFCPGNTDKCKTANLSGAMIDHRINRQISQLIVKCQEETCCYECPMKNIDEHLRFCPKKSVSCPFNDIGCDRGQMAGDKLNEHLQLETCHHSQILIDIIGNLRNEMALLKLNGEKENIMKDAIIQSISEEIKSMKLEKAQLERQIGNLMQIIDNKMDTRFVAQQIDILEKKHDKTIMEMNAALKRQEKTILEMNVASKRYEQAIVQMGAKFGPVKQEWSDELQQPLRRKYEKCDNNKIPTECKIDNNDNYLQSKSEEPFLWTIDNIKIIKNRQETVYSKYFNGCVDRYKMRLRCGWSSYYSGYVYIYLRISADKNDDRLEWPFRRDITITIINQSSPLARKAITKHCKIQKPAYNSYMNSDDFVFNYTELTSDGLLLGNCLTMECVIHDR